MSFANRPQDINRNGRPKRDPNRIVTKREVKEQELLSLLRKFKPNVTQAVITAARIMNSPTAADTSKLKAAVIILDNYKELVGKVYDGIDEEDAAEEVDQEAATVFSLKVIE